MRMWTRIHTQTCMEGRVCTKARTHQERHVTRAQRSPRRDPGPGPEAREGSVTLGPVA